MKRFYSGLFLFLLLLSSCTLQKRHYREGWYFSLHHKTETAPAGDEREARLLRETAASPAATEKDTAMAASQNPDSLAPAPETRSHTPEKTSSVASEPLPKMSYQEAKGRMKEQGCVPHPWADTVYIGSLISLALVFVGGMGFLLALGILIFSFFAAQKVRESGNCVDENLAIIRKGRMISAIFLLLVAALVALFLGLINSWFVF